MHHTLLLLAFFSLCVLPSISLALGLSVPGPVTSQHPTTVLWNRKNNDISSFCIVALGLGGAHEAQQIVNSNNQLSGLTSVTFPNTGNFALYAWPSCDKGSILPPMALVSVKQGSTPPSAPSNSHQDPPPPSKGKPPAEPKPQSQDNPPSNPQTTRGHGSSEQPEFDHSPTIPPNPIPSNTTNHVNTPFPSASIADIPNPAPGAIVLSKRTSKTPVILGAILGIMVLLSVIALIIWHCRRTRNRKNRTTIFYREKMIRPRSFQTFWKPLPPTPGTVSVLRTGDPQMVSSSSWASIAPDLDHSTTHEGTGSEVTSIYSTSTSHTQYTPERRSVLLSSYPNPQIVLTGPPGGPLAQVPSTPSLQSSLTPTTGHS